jgi:diguanylate cyclase (GGDEF)-like protein
MRRGERRLHAYVAVVSLAGLAALVLMVWVGDRDLVDRHWAQVLVLGACTVLGELRPVRLARRQGSRGDGGGSITTSTVFGYAMLLMVGPAPAAVALALGTVIADFHGRKSWYKALYNLAQYSLSVAAAASVIRALSSTPVLLDGGLVRAEDVVPLLLACVTFFIVNSSLVGAVVSLAMRAPVLPGIRDELFSQFLVDGLLLGMAPVVVVVAIQNLGLIPFLLLPVAAVYMSARDSLEKQHQALHDALTGLPNRTLFREQAGEVIAGRAKRDAAISAVLLIDLDRFKEINDTLGHHIGDLMLKEVGPRLREAVRADDVVARFGGDEFAIFIADAQSVDHVLQIAGRARAALSEPFTVEDLQLHVEGSVGIALIPEHGKDIDTLLQRADVAMYMAKETHSGSRLYTPDADPNSRRRLTLLSDLRAAIDNRDLVLHYQPKADLRTRTIADVEALVRWVHPDLGLVPPNDFIPLAERSGLIAPLTEYVLAEATACAADWRARGIHIRVAVNLSVRSLMDLELPNRVAQHLADADLPADYLELEITESTVMADPVRAMRVLQPLADMGVRLSIDDFGTGYSSLAYLRQLPIAELKIDRSFIAAMETSENDAVIVRSTIEMGKNLGLEIVAEGVETPDIERALDRLGCDYIQGYLLTRPLPSDELEPVLVELGSTWARQPGSLRMGRAVGS